MSNPRTTPLPARAGIEPVRNGTGEQLARIAHFRDLETTQPEELDAVALFLLGDIGDAAAKWELWEETLHEPCSRLWHLITDDWDDRDLDDAVETDAGLTDGHALDARYERTRDRLCAEIERAIYVARYQAAHLAGIAAAGAAVLAHPLAVTDNGEALAASMQRHPSGSRIPAHLTGSDRRGGGHPLGDYLHLKGEGR